MKSIIKTHVYEKYIRPTFIKRNKWLLLTVVIGLILMNLIFLFKQYRNSLDWTAATIGQLGDFVGGYIGTLFAVISVAFLYVTFENQVASGKIESFENKYFQLIQLHRDNVSEVGIGRDFGRKIFVILIREFRSIHEKIIVLAELHNIKLSQKDFMKLSYVILFFGVGPNSSRILKAALLSNGQSKEFAETINETFNDKKFKRKVQSDKRFRFTPFEGHQSRLGHYYRHLYQTICYVDEKILDIDKYDFVKTIRAQLSTHEQALLYLNSLTDMGKPWWDKDLIIRYKLVQNIPKDFFNPIKEIDITGDFPSDYFEWQH